MGRNGIAIRNENGVLLAVAVGRARMARRAAEYLGGHVAEESLDIPGWIVTCGEESCADRGGIDYVLSIRAARRLAKKIAKGELV